MCYVNRYCETTKHEVIIESIHIHDSTINNLYIHENITLIILSYIASSRKRLMWWTADHEGFINWHREV